jgi:hypothetical protein
MWKANVNFSFSNLVFLMEQSENVQTIEAVEVLKNEASLSLLTKAEIDTQIATAKAFPRSIKQFMNKTLSIATINEDVADSCAYALPRADKTLEGPSVRLAEIVAGCYGNLRAGMRVVANDGKTITAQGICHDLETNTCVTLEVKRSILQNVWEDDPTRPGKRRKSGRMETMTEDMQVVTGNAACAIAFRNVVFKVVPAALIQDIYEKVKEVARGSAETMPVRRKKALDYLHSLGVKDDQIASVLQLKSVDDIDLDKLAILRGMVSSLKNQESTVADLFPKLNNPQDKANAATAAAEKLAKKTAEKKEEKKSEDPK